MPESEARQLLGVPPGTNILDLDPTRFSEDALLRISCVIGIYKALHIYCPDDLADQWVRRANDGAMFGGRSPLAYMTSGGLEALRGVRKMLDAWCQGY